MAWFLSVPMCYAAAVLFLAAAAWRTWSLARLPRHIRWELYPLPGDGPAGSKYQQLAGATRPHGKSHLREVLFIAQEILLLKKVFRHGRRLWLGSFLLHVGLYLCALAAMLLALPVPLRAAGLVGLVGVSAGMLGTLYLLILRLVNPGLRRISDAATFFHLTLLAAMFAAWLAAGLPGTGNLAILRTHLSGLLCADPQPIAQPTLLAAIAMTALFLVYLPWSRMFHVVAKYFFYHNVLWENEPLRPGSRLEREMSTYLGYTVSWSAEHLRSRGTWAEQAAGGDAHE